MRRGGLDCRVLIKTRRKGLGKSKQYLVHRGNAELTKRPASLLCSITMERPSLPLFFAISCFDMVYP